jgi:hypothetical protein
MGKETSVTEVIDEIYQSVMATPRHQRRLLSKTLWDRFGFKYRSQDRVEQVRRALTERCLMVNLDDKMFGKEPRDEWIVLTYVEPPLPTAGSVSPVMGSVLPLPTDSWFATMATRVFESEREVEYYFIMPLLEKLGYEEDDFAIGFPVSMYGGTKRETKVADCVVFNGKERSKEAALVIVEAKKTGKQITEDTTGQARSYATWLSTPYYLITNGDDIRIYLFRGAVLPDVSVMTFTRAELRENWEMLCRTLTKPAVVNYKERLNKILGPDKPVGSL